MFLNECTIENTWAGMGLALRVSLRTNEWNWGTDRRPRLLGADNAAGEGRVWALRGSTENTANFTRS